MYLNPQFVSVLCCVVSHCSVFCEYFSLWVSCANFSRTHRAPVKLVYVHVTWALGGLHLCCWLGQSQSSTEPLDGLPRWLPASRGESWRAPSPSSLPPWPPVSSVLHFGSTIYCLYSRIWYKNVKLFLLFIFVNINTALNRWNRMEKFKSTVEIFLWMILY